MMKLKEFFDKKEKWCKGTSARRVDGSACDPLSPDAVKFCLIGACNMLHLSIGDVLKKLLPVIAKQNYLTSVRWNDGVDWKTFKQTLEEADV